MAPRQPRTEIADGPVFFPPQSYSSVPEELVVLHEDGFLVLISGQSITATLRKFQQDLWQDIVAGGHGVSGRSGTDEELEPDSLEVWLELCKVALMTEGQDKQTFADFIPCGRTLGSALDVFCQDANRCVVTVGSNPTVACYDFRPEAVKFSAGGVLKAVTSKVAQAGVAVLKGGIKLGGWFFGAAAEEEEVPEEEQGTREKPQQKVSTTAPCRACIPR